MSPIHLSPQVQQLADELVRRRRDLHLTANIARDDHIGLQGQQIFRLALRQMIAHFRLQ